MTDELEFFAEVHVNRKPFLDQDGQGQLGVVIGKSQDVDTCGWFYTVMVYGLGEAVVVPGHELQPTGRTLPRESVYGGESQRVVVDPITGRGYLPKEEMGQQ